MQKILTSGDILVTLEKVKNFNPSKYKITNKNLYSLVLTVKDKFSDKENQLNHLSFTFNISGDSNNTKIEFKVNYLGFRKVLVSENSDKINFGKIVDEMMEVTDEFSKRVKDYNRIVKNLDSQKHEIDILINKYLN